LGDCGWRLGFDPHSVGRGSSAIGQIFRDSWPACGGSAGTEIEIDVQELNGYGTSGSRFRRSMKSALKKSKVRRVFGTLQRPEIREADWVFAKMRRGSR
jgi:hypothetical protein